MKKVDLFKSGVLFLALITIGGCCDKYKKQVDQLTLDKQDLQAQLNQIKSELDNKQAALTDCQDKLSQLRGKETSLMKELEAARKLAAKIPAGWEIRKGMAMTSLSDAVLFDPGRATLKPSSYAKLNKIIAQILSKFPDKDVYIIGHTDSDPIRKSKWKDNLELSLHRAAAVARYMISHGLDPRRVIVAGAGQYRPIASNKTGRGKAKNRRVEFWILKPLD